MTVSKLMSSAIMAAGILVVMLSIGCLLALLPVLFISAGFEVEFDVVFVWLGMPFSILFALSWFYKYAGFAKSIIFRR
ncbi:hypothetical protein [Pseudomonas edaphica]|uniref:hypothetical protein n=1 Tax=Pseudomonas edaphica TaxID=2006980 RepID=UPI003D0CEC77